jgi:pimeloyl-ACP methyl ester carboxylesterase
MERMLALRTGEIACSVYGAGPPIVVLHRDVVAPGLSPYVEALGEHHQVYSLDLPGFGRSPRPSWMRNVTQLATLTGHAIEALGLPACPLVGLGFGGWVAADLATQGFNHLVSELVLVSPWGVKPSVGEIADFVLFDLGRWASMGFHDAERYIAACGDPLEYELMRTWDNARECVTAVAWKPIGHSRPLRAMLPLLAIPTLLAWGEEDAIVPASCMRDWAEAIPGASTLVLANAGHQVDLEAPKALAAATLDFVRSHQLQETR